MPVDFADLLADSQFSNPPTAVGAIVAAATTADDLYVTVPDYDDQIRFGPCPFVGPLPARGDECLVVFDDERQPWAVVPGLVTGGDQGPPGPPGATGPAGAQGVQGVQGPTGATGAAGATGAQGPQGPQGATGTGVTMKGSVATSANLPPSGNTQGDAYIVQADDSLWIWNGTAWVSGGSIQGPPGATGAQGVKGDTGATGATGPQGVQGVQGVKGDTGAMGPTGTVYDTDQIGTVKAFTGKTFPTNWMLADGRTLQRGDYPQLADVLGVAVGAPTFTIPDLRSKFILGPKGDLSDLYGTGGEASHVLTVAEMPSHNHGGGNHAHAYQASATQQPADGRVLALGSTSGAGTYGGVGPGQGGNNAIQDAGGIVTSQGGGTAHNTLPPYVILAHIIKASGAQIDAAGALVGPQGPQGVPGTPAAPLPLDTMHIVGAAGEPVFQNGWVNYGGVEATAGFRKEVDGRVALRGLIKSGSVGFAAFTLPVGYRPPSTVRFPVISNEATTGYVYVHPTTGNVVPQAGSNAYFDLAQVEFDTETVAAMPVGPQGPKGDTGPAGSLTVVAPDVKFYGDIGQTADVPGGGWDVTDAAGNPVLFTLTPTIDCWWITSANVLTKTTTAAWCRLQLDLTLTPADADGHNIACGSIMCHSGGSDWNEGNVQRSWKLAKNTTYTVKLHVLPVGGTFQMYRHNNHLWLAHDGIRPR